MSYERCNGWWLTLSGDERADVLSMVNEISDGWAKRMIAADIVPVPAELADGDGGYRSVWLMPATLRDFLEQRRTAEHPFT